MKKWGIILAALIGVWGVIFALMHWAQTPRQEDTSNKPKHLSLKTRDILDTSEQFVLLSLEPLSPGQAATPTAEKFYDCPVLGRLEVKDPKQKAELLSALYRGIDDSHGTVAACWNPRHGIRATKGTNWVELVICFQCSYMQEYGTGESGGASTTKSPGETFNRVLKQAGLPLSTK